MTHIRVYYGACNLKCKYCYMSDKNKTQKIGEKWLAATKKVIKKHTWITWYLNNLDIEFVDFVNDCKKTNTIFWRGTSTTPISVLQNLPKSHFIISYDKDDINGTNEIAKKALLFLKNTDHKISIISLITAQNVMNLNLWASEIKDEFQCDIKLAKLYISKFNKNYQCLKDDIVDVPKIKGCHIFDMKEDNTPWIIKNKYYYKGKTFRDEYIDIY